MQVTVLTNHRLDADKRLGDGYTPADRKIINWNDSSDRKWLMNHLMWAMHNARVVHMVGPAIESN